ncbi:DUF4276 family protein [Variovorax sp. tm]|uniref:DUF4276 family protein n=1 Tax=Variovorax atrisoli TaxID=3394203 RepID=UPI003A80A63E
MATLNRSDVIQFGVIAEDDSDVKVVDVILKKYAPANSYKVKKFVGSGCGRLKNKCRVWTETLFKRGCKYVLVLHDLDRSNLEELRKDLQKKIPKDQFPNSLIVIPVEELEAWLLSDENALRDVFSLKSTPKRYANCEATVSPKEEIGRLIWAAAKKRYINTVHNERIAERASLDNLKRCSSYLPLDKFLADTVFP